METNVTVETPENPPAPETPQQDSTAELVQTGILLNQQSEMEQRIQAQILEQNQKLARLESLESAILALTAQVATLTTSSEPSPEAEPEPEPEDQVLEIPLEAEEPEESVPEESQKQRKPRFM